VGRKNDLGATVPECFPVSAGLCGTIARKSSIGAFVFVQRVRHSENLYLIHKQCAGALLYKDSQQQLPCADFVAQVSIGN